MICDGKRLFICRWEGENFQEKTILSKKSWKRAVSFFIAEVYIRLSR
jgi:hypothetical protein